MISLWFCTINVVDLYWNLIVVLTGIYCFRLASTIYCWDFRLVNNGDFFVYDVICCNQFSSCLPLMTFTECAESMVTSFRSEFQIPKRSLGPNVCSTPMHLKWKKGPAFNSTFSWKLVKLLICCLLNLDITDVPTILKILKMKASL